MGKIELDHTGAGSGVTLSSDGTDLLLNGTAIGGGGTALELYAENPSSPTAPSATGTNAVAIGSGATASDTNAVAFGTDAEAGTYSVGIGWGAGNIGPNNVIIGRTDTIYSQSAVVIGHNADCNDYGSYQTAIGYEAHAMGSNATALAYSYASGSHSFAAAIANNTSSYGATGANSVAIGYRAKASSSWTTVVGGNSGTASGSYSTVLGGRTNSATASYSVASGFNAKADINGKFAHSAGSFSSQGDAQIGIFVLRCDTTDATPEPLKADNFSLSNQIILPDNSAYAFHGTIVAREQASAGTDCAAWKIEGLIRREGSAGTTVLVNSATTVIDNTPSWGMALSADTTNGGLKIEVTGAAATNIRWVATVHTSEVTY